MIAIGVWGVVILLLLDRALALAPASLTAPFLYTQCLWSAVMLCFSHSFYFRVPALMGSVLIVGSCVWILMHERVNTAVKDDPPVAAARRDKMADWLLGVANCTKRLWASGIGPWQWLRL